MKICCYVTPTCSTFNSVEEQVFCRQKTPFTTAAIALLPLLFLSLVIYIVLRHKIRFFLITVGHDSELGDPRAPLLIKPVERGYGALNASPPSIPPAAPSSGSSPSRINSAPPPSVHLSSPPPSAVAVPTNTMPTGRSSDSRYPAYLTELLDCEIKRFSKMIVTDTPPPASTRSSSDSTWRAPDGRKAIVRHLDPIGGPIGRVLEQRREITMGLEGGGERKIVLHFPVYKESNRRKQPPLVIPGWMKGKKL